MKQVLAFSFVFAVGCLLSFVINPDYSLKDSQIIAVPTLSFADGSVYVGELDDQGLLAGVGKLIYANGDYYQGHFSKGLFEGQGEYRASDGEHYIGSFSQGVQQGKGMLSIAGDYHYSGDFLAGVFHGQGELVYENGARYQGEFVNGEFSGEGRYELDGTVYEGDFVADDFSGEGTISYKDRGIYQGEMSNWLAHGKASYKNQKGDVWQGNFNSGSLSGEGTFTGVNGESYQGNFERFLYQGQGLLIDKEGDEYRGEFSYGQKEGKGHYRYKQAVDGITEFDGVWRYGTLQSTKAFNFYSPEEITAYAINEQYKILDRDLQAIAAVKSDTPKVYFLGIAGYGKEEVFSRELRFAQAALKRRLGDNMHSLLLINSQRSIGDYAFASEENIIQAIDTIAKSMNKKTDLLLVYATSHGSKKHALALSNKGIALRDMPAQNLAQALAKSAITHKAIIVSACYSGGFIAPLKDANSLLISSAAADKKSFGCADNNQFTYFGEAFFKESFVDGASLAEAFVNAQALVAQWEKADDYTPSEPQIHQPKAALKFLQSFGL